MAVRVTTDNSQLGGGEGGLEHFVLGQFVKSSLSCCSETKSSRAAAAEFVFFSEMTAG